VHRVGHRDVPPDVATGCVVVVVGADVVGVVVDVRSVPDVVVVVVDVAGERVDVVSAELVPGCSSDTRKPIKPVAPMAAITAARVTRRTRTLARSRASGVLGSSGRVMGGDRVSSAWVH